MRFQGFSSLLLHFLLFSSVLSLTSASKSENFIQCLTNKLGITATNIIYSTSNPSYTPILDFLLLNLRYGTPTTPKPQFIVTPIRSHHIQAAVICSKKQSLQIRVRSGGHDYEGFSYVSHQPFVIIDLFNMQDVKVDINRKSAWVQTGATIGKVHYKIAEKSNTLGFPGSICTTVGVGGLIGGGGIGFMWRKYGLSADNILDARIIDVKGRYLNRKSMGEDLFWAIRGGGASSFGVVVAWKLQLVSVPPIVTVFRLPKTIEEGSLPLVHKWQNVAPQFPKDLHMLTLNRVVQAENGTKTIETTFLAVFQGRRTNLVSLMETRFPELGLKPENCTEMSWVNSTMFVFGLNGPVENLLNRAQRPITYWKGGSDYVRKAISLSGLEGLWKVMLEVGDEYLSGMVVTEPMGGRNDEISASAIPFPHRKGNLFMIQYNLNWQNAGDSPRYLAAAKKVYNFMTPFASKSPRSSYFNYRDANLGVNKDYNTSYKEASVWGIPYFQSNFKKLATVKSKVDPENYFWNEQSIPPFAS